MSHTAHRFGVIDDLGFVLRTSLLVLCGLTCCWGFVNDAPLLVLASKVGFPMAVAVCAISIHWKQFLSLLYYTVLLCNTGYFYFLYNPAVILPLNIIDRYIPQWMDLYLATGLGLALSILWNHPIRINVVVASAGLASLLPACIMTGYHLQQHNMEMALASLALYGEYSGGLVVGAILHRLFEYLAAWLNSIQSRSI
ncbi:DUF389 domain-containing protein [Candidatus Woesearchaeota archaeon]|nr:DUF389 domain-containing protein [Candidatus Woesearchaeota archaeon]